MKIQKRVFVLFVLAAWFVANISFAGILKGKVTDTKGELLSFATIYVEGTTIGTNANADGVYELYVPQGLHTVVCQFIGYEKAKINVDIPDNSVKVHDFKLAAQGLQMKEVIINSNAEDPAYDIIRKAIKRRKEHLAEIETFQSDIYLKGKIALRKMPELLKKQLKFNVNGNSSDGQGLLYLVEENARYYNNGKKERLVIESVHESGNPNGLGASRFPTVISLYQNNVKISSDDNSRGYISPIADFALTNYKYKFLGQFMDGDEMVYKVEVIPRRTMEPCFKGTIYLLERDYSIHSCSLDLDKNSGMDFIDTFKLNQIYVPSPKGIRVIKSQVIYFAIGFAGIEATADFVTVYNNARPNAKMPDTLFADKIVSSYEKDATKRDSSYWKEKRPIPLVEEEKKDYVVKDSIFKKVNDPAYKDSIRKKANKLSLSKILISGISYRTKESKTVLNTNSLLLGISEDNALNYNVAEGFNFAPRLNVYHRLDSNSDLHIEGSVRYGFANTHLNAMAKIYKETNDRSWKGRYLLYGIEGGKYVFQFNSEKPVTQLFDTYSSLLYRQNDIRLYEKWLAAAFVRRDYANGLNWFIKASFEHRLPLYNTSDYSIFPNNYDGWKDNNPANLVALTGGWNENNAMLIHASIAYQPGFTYTKYPEYIKPIRGKFPTLQFTYDQGIPNVFDSKSDFSKWKFSVSDETVHLKLWGDISYNFSVGGFMNNNYVSIPDLNHLYGNRGFGYAAPYLESFQFAPYYLFSNKAYFYKEAHIEYHMNGLLSNKIPLLKQARWYLVWGGNAFYIDEANYYSEAFVGLENIGYKALRVLRVDFVQSWDCLKGRNSGLRFRFDLGNGREVNKTGSDW